MYNFSGVFYRVWGVCGIILFWGVVILLFKKPWAKTFNIKKCKIALLFITVAVCMGLVYTSRIVYPNVSSYTGEFVYSSTNNRVAPPLPLTKEYVFKNGEEKLQTFYLDVLSKKEVYPYHFETGKKYTIYFDNFTNIIVKIEFVE